MKRSAKEIDSTGWSRRGALGVLCGTLLGAGARRARAEGVQQTARMTATGFYDGTNGTKVVATSLTRVLVFRVFQTRANGPGAQAHKTLAMQDFAPPGVTASEATRLFLNADRVDSGMRFEEGGRVVIENTDFIAAGSRYYWEAQGE